MTALDTDDLAVVTQLHHHECLLQGEVVRVIEPSRAGDVYVFGLESHKYGYIRATGLVPLSDIHVSTKWDDVKWGAEDEEYVRLSEIHDYIYTEDDE